MSEEGQVPSPTTPLELSIKAPKLALFAPQIEGVSYCVLPEGTVDGIIAWEDSSILGIDQKPVHFAKARLGALRDGAVRTLGPTWEALDGNGKAIQYLKVRVRVSSASDVK